MPICPSCKKKIEHLHCLETGTAGWVASINGEVLEYQQMDNFFCGNGDDKFECPECEKVLFTNEEDAKNFLNNKIIIG